MRVEKRRPKDYHCACAYCKNFFGELVRPDGTRYSRIDRRRYYSPVEIASTKEPTGHIAKTPLHIARWAVQAFTKPGDWVLDPTAGAGTTLVEALTHGRNAVGVEIESIKVLEANVEHASKSSVSKHAVVHGDARDLAAHLKALRVPRLFALVVTNPPYFGDQSQKGLGPPFKIYAYDKTRANLAFLREGQGYYDELAKIYATCAASLAKGGRIVLGVKDQMRKREPDLLHKKIGDVIAAIPGMRFEGAAFLKHHPTTLFLNTYEKKTGVRPPLYQSILVFRKEK